MEKASTHSSALAPERAAVIDLEALAANAAALAARISPAELMAVVKADGYGHGAVTAARAAWSAGVRRFGVAHVREGLDLIRGLEEHGIGEGARVLAWLHTPHTDFAAALRAGIELGVNGTEIERVLEAAEATGEVPRLHLKADTGLGRNGALEDAWAGLMERLAELQREGRVRVVGLMTHLAVADEPERPETDLQREAFERAAALAERCGLAGLEKHAANTPAALLRPDLRYDVCRVGLGLYGLSPFPDRPAAEFGLTPAMSLETTLTLVKRAPTGLGVSYGHRFVAESPTHLGLVPLGYADGIPRIAEGARVTVDGREHPVVGRVAMDQFVVDLGPDESALSLQGRTVTVFGAPGSTPVEVWAEAAQTINYEIVTRISQRVDRVVRGALGREAESLPLGRHEAPEAEDMRRLGERLGRALRKGDAVVLSGPLGAGKTTLTQGIARGLGAEGRVISPTFVLSRIHRNDPEGPRPGGPDLVHVDAYRLGPHGDLDSLGLDDTAGESVTVIEWGESVDPAFGERRLRVEIERAGLSANPEREDGGLSFDEDEDEGADVRTVSVTLVRGDGGPGREEGPGRTSTENGTEAGRA
ncbi:alanine racemase [Arthrobacter sp. UM1]|uniref:alanine racemase n=1 Tax=Arthrobacter sp. UM1 TaxID=2766776 RepID=UPI001CF6194D|nr:alanine racemase [Arthrobacter sp. UM1]MCB4208247.1 alanine racemase [Arthrobacter sp. UM1]